MPTLQDIEAVVAKLTRENGRISLRNVRAVLPRGGSYSDIWPVLAARLRPIRFETGPGRLRDRGDQSWIVDLPENHDRVYCEQLLDQVLYRSERGPEQN